MVGKEGKGARPGMLRGGKDTRGGTGGDRRKTKKDVCYFFARICI